MSFAVDPLYLAIGALTYDELDTFATWCADQVRGIQDVHPGAATARAVDAIGWANRCAAERLTGVKRRQARACAIAALAAVGFAKGREESDALQARILEMLKGSA